MILELQVPQALLDHKDQLVPWVSLDRPVQLAVLVLQVFRASLVYLVSRVIQAAQEPLGGPA